MKDEGMKDVFFFLFPGVERMAARHVAAKYLRMLNVLQREGPINRNVLWEKFKDETRLCPSLRGASLSR